ncbi:extracellular solute-binding protein [Paenibacillus sp. S3N08]|uniref:Extracellular solute-binding protein n=2 Tax=Paenibacillus agricola TaxID=2716264 RepID=A0ABX0JIE0_9BACL|nr:extracellular solute-binding protein [Paenibacillus agricola]
MLGGLIAGCSGGGQVAAPSAPAKDAGGTTGTTGTTAPATTPATSSQPPKAVTFTWLAANRVEGPVKQDWETFKEIEKKTGVKIDFQVISEEALLEKRKIMIATNTVTDFILIPTQDGRDFGPEKVFLNLKNYLDKAPNIKKFFDANPEAKAQATAADGGYYTMPVLESDASTKGFNYAWYTRKDLHDKYGLKAPTTLDEFYQYLKALKDKHPDSYPLTFRTPLSNPNLTGIYTVFLRAFTGVEGFINQTPDKDEYEFAGYHKGFKDSLLYMNKLYNEKLLEPEFALLTTAQWEERLLTGKSMVTYFWKADFDPLIDKARKANASNKDFEMNVIPQFAADGIKNYQYARPAVGVSGLAISANVKDKDAAIKFMDFLYSEEGTNYMSLGILNKTYKMVDGKPRYMEEFGTSPYVPLRRDWGVWFPNVSINNAIARAAWERGLDAKNKEINTFYAKYIIDAPKSIVKNADEQEIEKSKLNNLNKYFEQKMTEFVTGKTPINDQTVNEFIDQSKKQGVDDLLKLYNASYKRTYGVK